VPGNLGDPAVPAEVVNSAAEQLGGLDALVMSHAESVDSGILDTTVESFDRHYTVNVRATWLLIAAFARQLPATGGSVVALTSDHAVGNLPYGVTKGGLDRLVLASAHELADAGVRANVINPGPIDTGWMTDEIRASGIAQQPTGVSEHRRTPPTSSAFCSPSKASGLMDSSCTATVATRKAGSPSDHRHLAGSRIRLRAPRRRTSCGWAG
jgi:NAD(P)-dependent dehydrogenase (short-subunit alcohol dehydrogenase family)